ncbi:MAG: hypothetical protein ACPGTP_01655 [Bacteroidia bacterium]
MAQKPFAFGVSPLLNQTYGNGKYEPGLSVGLGFFGTYMWKPNLSFAATAEYNHLIYSDDNANFNYLSDDLSLKLGLKKSFYQLDNSALILQAVPITSLRYIQEYKGTNNQNEKRTNLIPMVDSRFSLGIYAGFELDFKGRSSLELGYRHVVTSQETNSFIDAVPHHFSLAYKINFNAKKRKISKRLEMLKSLSKLKNSTLYVINRTCDKYSLSQVDSIFAENYTFSRYKILKDSEIEATSQRNDIVHFAVIGRYYASKGDPESNGIYLLDKDLEICEYPFPYYEADNSNFLDPDMCISSISYMARLVSVFNKRLYKSHRF